MVDSGLQASRRTVLGKAVKRLRRGGVIPARLYGPHTPPLPLQLDAQAFQKVLARAGSLTLLPLVVEGEKHTVLIREVQRNATTDRILHVDLFAVAMSEPLRATVPLVLVGEAPAVKLERGVLLRSLDHVEVESLPADLPHQIEVDISGLAEFESAVHVRDLVPPIGVTIHTPGDELVAKVAAPVVEEEPALPAVPAAAVVPLVTPQEEEQAEAGA